MATRKVTITVPEDLVEELTARATADDVPLSRLVTDAIRQELRHRRALDAVAEWQAEHPRFTEVELADMAARMAAEDARAHQLYASSDSAATHPDTRDALAQDAVADDAVA